MPRYVDVREAARALRVHPSTIVRNAGLPYRPSTTRVPLADLCRGIDASPATILAFINGQDHALTSDEIASAIGTTSRHSRAVINLAGLKPVAKFGRGHRYSRNAITKREADGMIPAYRSF